MAGPGVGDQAGRDKWKKMEENFFFSRDSDAPFGPKVRGFEARLGPELLGCPAKILMVRKVING